MVKVYIIEQINEDGEAAGDNFVVQAESPQAAKDLLRKHFVATYNSWLEADIDDWLREATACSRVLITDDTVIGSPLQ